MSAEFGVLVLERQVLLGEALRLAISVHDHPVVTLDTPLGPAPHTAYLNALRALAPRIVLVDLEPIDAAAPALVASLASAAPSVVVLTASEDPAWWGLCLHLGAHSVVTKSERLSGMLATLDRVAAGRPTMGSARRERLLVLGGLAHAEDTERRRRLALLSDRESAMLAHLMAGHHVAEIARVEVVSPSTVRTQVRAVLAKLEVTSQLAAVALAHRSHWRSAS
ncbi:helix-turn-helix transcriptional regulator [Nocardioides zeae]|uniref:Response regulator transcription factor n=1 Tax=Nocardioides zeae TaxID=1457234 RepID=A0A6P0HG84_9ACTN|nr:LuxR C-terminal-related transcriptional regulator [Nocardioides zeae]NEN77297.1 response regulator transcription factor [Nocardioides zeae]